MNEFQTQLAELFDLQRALDQRILGDKPYPLQQMILAFIAEVGELLKECESLYKHWKKHPVDNRQRMLEEYVDCLHFALSICNHGDNTHYFLDRCDGFEELADFASLTSYLVDDENEHIVYLLVVSIQQTYGSDSENAVISLLALGFVLGFTWPEIYEEYKRKNAINHQRQEEGY